MNLSRIFILRPIATTLLMVALVLIGAVAYTKLPVSALPQVDYPTMQVVTYYPGASPEVIASSVTAPLERQFGQVPGLQQLTSTSSESSSVITLQFDLKLDIDVAEQQVQQAINLAQPFLPRDLPNPPTYSKVNPADAPILTLALTSKTMPLSRVHDFADTRLAQKIAQLPGVGLVTVSGGQKPAVRIQVNPLALSAHHLNLEDVRTAVTTASVNQAKGTFDGAQQSFQIGANDQLLASRDYASLIIAHDEGAAVRLSDVAEVVDDAENHRQAAWKNNDRAVILSIQRQPGANIIKVVDSVQELLPTLRASLPAAIDIDVLSDRTRTIRASVHDVQFELCLTVALVVMVIFLFLRNLSATIIPSVAVPLSLIGTFAVMHLLGFSLNNLSLMALTISAGFVVDDAIVMIENIARYVEEGEDPLAAALKGAKQVGFTILSLTISLIAVLIPLLFMSDIVGRLFREFAITLSVAILVSAVVSLTLTPMMCSRLLKHHDASQQGAFFKKSEQFFTAVIAFYGRTLQWVLQRQTLTLLIATGTVVLTVVMYLAVPKGFFPIQDTGLIQGVSEASQSISFPAMASRQQELVKHILADPAVASVSSYVGVDGVNTTLNSGRIQISLKPPEERDATALAIIRRLQPELAKVAGITLFMQPVQDLTIEDRASRTQFQYTLESPSAAELNEWAPKMVEQLRALPELRDVASDNQDRGLRTTLMIDRDTASRLGITTQMIDDALYNAFGQRQIATMFTQLNQYRVVLELHPDYRRTPAALDKLYIAPAGGRAVPLSAIARWEETNAPLTINHQGQFPVVTLSFNLAPGVSLGDAVQQIDRVRDSIGLPESIRTHYQGAARVFQAALANQPVLILAALVTVYIVLGVLYESFIHPVTILSTLPSAGIGALLALMLFGQDLGIIALIGIILLIGIVKKNAIMMVDFALDAQRTQGMTPADAIYQACLLRFRPIMMTTMAALFGAVPLAFGTGTGSELRQPLGITIIGGLIVSQVLTLYTTPVIYLWFDRLAQRFGFASSSAVVDEVPGSS